MFKKSLVSLMILGLVFAGCATNGGGTPGTTSFDVCSAVTGVQVQQGVVETAAATIVSLHNTKVVPDDVYAKAQKAYAAWAASQVTAMTALVALNDAGGKASAISIQQYIVLSTQMVVLVANFMAVYSSISASSLADPLPVVSPTPVPSCVMTDAQITQALTVTPWSSFALVHGN